MLVLVTIATIVMLLNLAVQLTLITGSTKVILAAYRRHNLGESQTWDAMTMGIVLIMVLLGHLVQIALWAFSFIWCGEFEDFRTAFYHSAVNFASLGYGDIVMSEEWRLLGALEAAVGVMMFGVSAALLFSIISKLMQNRFKIHNENN